MQFADLALARRFEAAEAAATGACARCMLAANPSAPARVEEIAGGHAICVDAGSPLNKCVGLGLHGPVTVADLDRVEDVFRAAGRGHGGAPVRVVIDLCPLADPSILEPLARRGYSITELENVLYLPLAGWRPPPDRYGDDIEVRPARDDETDLWARTLARGFSGVTEVSDDMLRLGITIFRAPGCRAYLALAGGQVAGGGGMSTHDGVAALYGTAILPEFRNKGAQTAMLRARLADAIAAGCDTAKVTTRPGTTSQRNAERHGFHIAYTKPQLVRTL